MRFKKYIWLLVYLFVLFYLFILFVQTVKERKKYKNRPSYHKFCEPYVDVNCKPITLTENLDHFFAYEHSFIAPKYEKYDMEDIPLSPPNPSSVGGYEEDFTDRCDAHIIAIVISSANHFRRRRLIRETWANPKYFNHTGIRYCSIHKYKSLKFFFQVVYSGINENNDFSFII